MPTQNTLKFLSALILDMVCALIRHSRVNLLSSDGQLAISPFRIKHRFEIQFLFEDLVTNFFLIFATLTAHQ